MNHPNNPANAQNTNYLRPIQIFVFICLLCFVAQGIWVYIEIFVLRKPYELELVKSGQGTLLKVYDPQGQRQTEQITVALEVTQNYHVILNKQDLQIPDVSVEFYDITIKPGVYKINLGKSKLRIGSSGVYLDDKEFPWIPDK